MPRSSLALLPALLLVFCAVNAAFSEEIPVTVMRKTTEPRTVAFIRQKGPIEELPDVIKRLYAEIDKGGYHVCGPLMAVYYNDPRQTPADEMSWDVRIPVTNPGPMTAVDTGKLGFGYQSPAYVAYTYHVGPLDTVDEAYDRLLEWAGTNQYQITGYVTEVYWSEPTAKMPVTEIWLPVEEKERPGRAVR
jgi:effector-binding domain-containing protein